MSKAVRMYVVDNENYLVSGDEINLGDSAIVTVGGEFPSIVKCENEQVMKLITDSKLSLTKAFKIVAYPNDFEVSDEEYKKLEENNWMCWIDGIKKENEKIVLKFN
jgi:hypothetical protein